MLRVGELRELFEAAETLGAGLHVAGDRLAILTNGGGAGVLAADALDGRGGRLAELSPSTLEALEAITPPNWSRRNPVDIWATRRQICTAGAWTCFCARRKPTPVLVMNCPTAVTDSSLAAHSVADAAGRARGPKPVLSAWLGEGAVAEGRRLLAGPAFRPPKHRTKPSAPSCTSWTTAGTRTLLCRHPSAIAICRMRRARDASSRQRSGAAAPPSPIRGAQLAGRLRRAGRRQPRSRRSRGGRSGGGAIGGPVALKILSRDLSHKSDVGGVALGLTGAAPRWKPKPMRCWRASPRHARQTTIDGFIVEAMVVRPRSQELLVGIAHDAGIRTDHPLRPRRNGRGGAGRPLLSACRRWTTSWPATWSAAPVCPKLLAGYRDRPPATFAAICTSS
jgi:acetyltransferase